MSEVTWKTRYIRFVKSEAVAPKATSSIPRTEDR